MHWKVLHAIAVTLAISGSAVAGRLQPPGNPPEPRPAGEAPPSTEPLPLRQPRQPEELSSPSDTAPPAHLPPANLPTNTVERPPAYAPAQAPAFESAPLYPTISGTSPWAYPALGCASCTQNLWAGYTPDMSRCNMPARRHGHGHRHGCAACADAACGDAACGGGHGKHHFKHLGFGHLKHGRAAMGGGCDFCASCPNLSAPACCGAGIGGMNLFAHGHHKHQRQVACTTAMPIDAGCDVCCDVCHTKKHHGILHKLFKHHGACGAGHCVLADDGADCGGCASGGCGAGGCASGGCAANPAPGMPY